MEPKIIELVMKRIKTAHEETRILYEMSEAEMILLSQLILELPIGSISPKLAGKMLRAAAHLIESTGDIADNLIREFKESKRD